MTALLSPAKDTLILVPIARADVEACDIASVLTRLRMLSSDRASAMAAEGCLAISFSGYDDDPRPVNVVPEIREFFAALDAAWPYWSFFASKTTDTLGLVLTLLLPGHSIMGEEPGMRGWEFDLDALQPRLARMLAAQCDLTDQLEISESVNMRVTDEFLEAVGTFL